MSVEALLLAVLETFRSTLTNQRIIFKLLDRFCKRFKIRKIKRCFRRLLSFKIIDILVPWYKVGEGGGGRRSPSPEFLVCCIISKRFAFNGKLSIFSTIFFRYIFWVVELLETCDVTNNGHHIGFYQELEISNNSKSQLILNVDKTASKWLQRQRDSKMNKTQTQGESFLFPFLSKKWNLGRIQSNELPQSLDRLYIVQCATFF